MKDAPPFCQLSCRCFAIALKFDSGHGAEYESPSSGTEQKQKPKNNDRQNGDTIISLKVMRNGFRVVAGSVDVPRSAAFAALRCRLMNSRSGRVIV